MHSNHQIILKKYTEKITVHLIFLTCKNKDNKNFKIDPLKEIIDYLDHVNSNFIRDILIKEGLFVITSAIVSNIINTQMDPKKWAAEYKLIGDGEEFIPILTKLKDEILKLNKSKIWKSSDRFNEFLIKTY